MDRQRGGLSQAELAIVMDARLKYLVVTAKAGGWDILETTPEGDRWVGHFDDYGEALARKKGLIEARIAEGFALLNQATP